MLVSIPVEICQADSAAWNHFIKAQPEFQGLDGQLLDPVSRTPVLKVEDLRRVVKDYWLFGRPGNLTEQQPLGVSGEAAG